MIEIISIEPLRLIKRMTIPLIVDSVFAFIFFLIIFIASKDILVGILSGIFLFGLFLVFQAIFGMFKYYVYKIEYNGNNIIFEYYIGNKKNILSANLKEIKIEYVKEPQGRGVINKIIIMKNRKILIEIKPRRTSATYYWDEYNILDLYEKLAEIQKQAQKS